MTSFSLLFVVIFLTLAFEFSNGWHDAANSIATVVSTRVLTPFRAVAWAAFWNFIAAFVFGTAVASTIGKGMIHIELINQQVLLAGLLGAITWNLITLILGLPTSSSHALIGGTGATATTWSRTVTWCPSCAPAARGAGAPVTPGPPAFSRPPTAPPPPTPGPTPGRAPPPRLPPARGARPRRIVYAWILTIPGA